MEQPAQPPELAAPRLLPADDRLREALTACAQDEKELWSSPNRDRRESIHALFQYPAMMVPVVQQRIIRTITEIQPGVKTLLDPFVGAGTTLVAAMLCGLDCFGQDINPLAVLLSQAKTGPFDAEDLSERVRSVINGAKGDRAESIDVNFHNRDKWFHLATSVELSRLRRAIQREKSRWVRQFLWVTLAETIRLTSNDRTSTYKLHMRSVKEIAERRPSPIVAFAVLADRNLRDVSAHIDAIERGNDRREKTRPTARARVALGDSSVALCRHPASAADSYSLLVTSPPYGDNLSTVTYGQHSYLPLQWIDQADIDSAADDSYLRTTQEIDRRSLGGRSEKELDILIERLGARSSSLARTFKQLSDHARDRRSRVATFYRDLDACLTKVVDALSINAYLVWTVGNRRVGGVEIPNDAILTELLSRRGVLSVTHVERAILNKRMAPRNAIAPTMRRERIAIFRKTAATTTE